MKLVVKLGMSIIVQAGSNNENKDHDLWGFSWYGSIFWGVSFIGTKIALSRGYTRPCRSNDG
ncbi:MAG: hypothetical protein ACOX6I_05725 [Syntrophomonadaceae bacterium]